MNDGYDSNSTVCSVCIANYNGESFIEDCLVSIIKQDFPHRIEVIVHDDASTDNSVKIIRSRFPQVKLIESKVNVGFCVSNNRMVNSAKGEYILLLNNDATLEKNALSTLYGKSREFATDGIFGLAQYHSGTGEFLDQGFIFDPFLNPVPNRKHSRVNVGMIMGACLWLPRKLWHSIGGFPDWFVSIAEDAYLCCRARLMGYPVIALPDSGFHHWVGQSLGGGKIINQSLQTTYRRRALSERNKSYVMILCYPPPLAFVFIPLHILLLMAEGLLLSIIKKDRSFWQKIYGPCISDLWYNRGRLWRLRRNIQKTRAISAAAFFSFHIHAPYKLRMLLKYGVPTVK